MYHKYIIKVVFAVLFCGFSLSANAQLPDYHLQLFDNAAGIRPGNILSVLKDNKGFLWILYPRQVQRFDGKHIKTFKPEGNFENLLCDDAGGIWISGQDKAMLLTDTLGDFKDIPVTSNDSNLHIGSFIQMPDHKIWLLTTAGFFEYNALQKKFIPTLRDLPLAAAYSAKVFARFKNIFFIKKDTLLYRYNLQTKKLDSLKNLEAYKIHPVNEDSVLISSWTNRSYWYSFTDHTITQANLPDKVKEQQTSSFDVKSMVEFAPMRFFMVSREGIFEYNIRNKEYRRLQFFMNGREVATNEYASSVSLDKEGFAWMTTIDGVARFSLNRQFIGLIRIRQLNDALPAAIDNVRRMVSDKNGNTWLATGNGFLCWKKDKKDWVMFLPSQGAKNKLEHPSVRGMVYDNHYIILGPTDLGIWLFDPETYRYKRPVYINDSTRKLSERDYVDDIITLNNGNHLIMGRDAVYVLNGKTYQLSMLDIPAAKENSNSAYQGKDGIVWLTTNKGLHCLDSALHPLENVTLPFKNKYITCGFMLPDNRLLFACADGLYTAARNNGKTELNKLSPVFNNVFLTTLYQDSKGVIWATSENGIYRFDPVSYKLNLFDYSDNVQGYSFNNNSWFRNNEGVLFFGGQNGINYLQPETFEGPDELLQVYISKVKNGDNDSILYSGKAPLFSYSNRSLEIEFVSPYFNNPEKVKYRYSLEGFNPDWKDIGNTNTLQLTSLPPGQYTLRVQASINDVDWISAKNNFTFYINPPFWLSWWFITLTLLLLAVIVWLIIRARNKKITEQKEEIEAEQAINYFAASIYQTHSEKAILWDVAKNCIGKLHFEDCVIYLADQEKKILIQHAAYGPKSPVSYEIKEPLIIPIGKGITGHVALTGKGEIIDDTTKDPRYIVDDEYRFSEITVPIVYDGKVLGVIDCEHSKKGFFTQKHLSILTTIASLCANKIIKARAEAEKLETERILMQTQQKMADIEMQALRAQMNPHFIFNCLNSINRYIVKSDQATASLYLTRFAKLIRLILDNSNSKSVTLANELEALRLYIEMESIRFEKQFSYVIYVDEDVQTDHLYIPPLIIQPYVENAIWHGLLHKESAGELKITISKRSAGVLQCIIEDNGVGRDKAKELKSKSVSSKKSLGMKLTENRLALLSKQSQLDSSVKVEDLKTNIGEAAGTKVILRIPVDA